MSTKLSFLLCLSICCQGYTQEAGEACRTPDRSKGTCINVKTCEPLLKILKTRPIAPASLQLLQRSQCGYEGKDPKVCCPSPVEEPIYDELPDVDTDNVNEPIPDTGAGGNRPFSNTAQNGENRPNVNTETSSGNRPNSNTITSGNRPDPGTLPSGGSRPNPNTVPNGGNILNTDTATSGGSRPNTNTATSGGNRPLPIPVVPPPTRFNNANQRNYYSEPPPSISGHRNLGLLPVDCGNMEDDRVIGGNKTGVFEFTWMALLAYTTERGTRFQCGGTIINPRYILTAAHCITKLQKRTLLGVRVGEHDLATEEDCEEQLQTRSCASMYQDMGIEESIPHPEYIGGSGTNARFQNDIGLIRLNREIDMTADNVHLICLPKTRALQELSLDNENPVVAGWGATEIRISSPDLLKISIPIVDNLQCGRVINGSIRDGVGYKQLCAGGLLQVDACGGDSGGPLKLLTPYEGVLRYVQYGIVSFGPGNCGREGVPGVYTRVPYYMDWILDNLKP